MKNSLSIFQFVIFNLLFSTAAARTINFKGPQALDLNQNVLGQSCHLINPGPGSIPCNPAQLIFTQRPQFVANVSLGENYQRIDAYRKDIEHKDELAVVNKLLEETEALDLQATGVLWVKNSWFSLAYIPLSMSFYSELRNRSYPRVDLKILVEESIRVQFAKPFEFEKWTISTGLQIRASQRETLFQELALFDVLADPELLDIQRHDSIHFDFGFLWQHKIEWSPKLSLFVQNMTLSNSGDSTPKELTKSYADLGFSLSPLKDKLWGRLETGVNYRLDKENSRFIDGFQMVANYGLGLMTTSASIGNEHLALGVGTSFLSAKTGISFVQKTLNNWDGGKKTDNSVNLEFGLVY